MTAAPPLPDKAATRQTPKRAMPWRVARTKWLPDFVARQVFGQPLAPTSPEWRAMQLALRRGDEPMDKVVAWMFAGSPRQTKALFDQALMQGIHTLENPPEVLREFFALIDTPPAWLDREKLADGIHAYRTMGDAAYYVLRDLALMGGYAWFNSMNQTLAATGALNGDVTLRLAETSKWAMDVTRRDGLDRFGPGFITTIRVRMVHALVRRHLGGKPDWDTDTWGIPINQVDMLATWLAFGPVTVTGARLFGVMLGREETQANLHLWRYVGWLSGVSEEFLTESEGDGLRRLYATFLTHRLPDEKIRLLGTALRQQPLSQPLPDFADRPRALRMARRWLYHVHLSNASLILGPAQRARLGIPFYAVPWYPLATAPLRFVRIGWYRWRGGSALDGFRERNRVLQEKLLAGLFGAREQDIIRPDARHPAHVE